jgi:hypothetical protein
MDQRRQCDDPHNNVARETSSQADAKGRPCGNRPRVSSLPILEHVAFMILEAGEPTGGGQDQRDLGTRTRDHTVGWLLWCSVPTIASSAPECWAMNNTEGNSAKDSKAMTHTTTSPDR